MISVLAGGLLLLAGVVGGIHVVQTEPVLLPTNTGVDFIAPRKQSGAVSGLRRR